MLSKQLQERIQSEAKGYASIFKHGGEMRELGYIDGATPYVERWQAAERRAERAENALKEIRKWQLTTSAMIKVKHLDILKDIMQTANEALTPKTGEDELHKEP